MEEELMQQEVIDSDVTAVYVRGVYDGRTSMADDVIESVDALMSLWHGYRAREGREEAVYYIDALASVKASVRGLRTETEVEGERG